MRRDVEFRSEGTVCRGWLYVPDAPPPHPTIVMAHGFSAVKEMRLDRFAAAFAEAGFAALAFDYRGFGDSDGLPRQDVDPHAQITDYRNALSYARTLSEVARERVGVWGTSYSGGHVLVVGALDRRVKAVVAQVPLIDAWDALAEMLGVEARDAMVAQLIDERERVYAGGEPFLLPVVSPEGGPAALPGNEAWEWFQAVRPLAPKWRNEITLLSLQRMLEYSPLRFVDRIAPTPLLLVAAERDFLPIDTVLRAYERAGNPKRLVRIAAGHFAPYEEPHFGNAVNEATGWFRMHL